MHHKIHAGIIQIFPKEFEWKINELKDLHLNSEFYF
jgi:hypothetical protein